MNKENVRSPEQALAYIVDCTLATVQSMAMIKSRKQGEFVRQISIAQTAIDWMVCMKVDFSSTRAQEVIDDFEGSVSAYADKYDVKKQ